MQRSTADEIDAPDRILLERAREALSQRFGVDDWVLPPGSRAARKSRLWQLHSPALGCSAVLKQYRESAAAWQQAFALQFAWPACSTAPTGFAVPELYAEFADANALLLEWADARQLEEVLVRAALQPRRHEESVRRAGAWLRWFHELGGISEAPFDSARYARLLAARTVVAPLAAARLAHHPLWSAALRRFDAGLRQLDGIPVPTALAHGDFTSTNLLLSPSRVLGIDLWAEHRLPVAEDLARMFVYLAAGDVAPLTARLQPQPLGAWRAQRALFAGYGEEYAREDDAWRQLVLFEVLARRLALGERLARRDSLVERWKCGGLQAVVRALVDGVDAD